MYTGNFTNNTVFVMKIVNDFNCISTLKVGLGTEPLEVVKFDSDAFIARM